MWGFANKSYSNSSEAFAKIVKSNYNQSHTSHSRSGVNILKPEQMGESGVQPFHGSTNVATNRQLKFRTLLGPRS